MDEGRAVRMALARVGRRLWLRRALGGLLRSTAGASAITCAILLGHYLGLGPDLRGAPLLGLVALGLLLAMIPRLRPVSAVQAARAADTAYGLGERLTTAVAVMDEPGPMQRLVVRDAARMSRGLDLSRFPRVALKRDAWLAASGVVLVIFLWLPPAVPSPIPGPRRSGFEEPDPLHGGPGGPRLSAGDRAPSSPGRGEPGGRGGLRQVLQLDAPNPGPVSSQTSGGRSADLKGGAGAAIHGERGAPDPGSGRGSGGRPPERPASAPPTTDGSGAEAQVGDIGPGSGVPGPASIHIAAGGGSGAAEPSAREGSRSSTGETPGSDSRTGDVTEVQAALARVPVPPALRQYILRYFEQLGRARKAERPS